MKLECEVTIDRPIQQVWDYTNNPENLKLWLNDFLRHEVLTGDGVTPAVGNTSNMTYAQGKGEFTMLEEVTSVDAPNHITLMMTSKMMDMEIVNRFESAGDDRTRLYAGANFVRLGFLMKCVMTFSSKKKMQADHERQIAKLKELIEAT